MTSVTLQVRGFDEVGKLLKDLPTTLHYKCLDAGMRAVGKVIAQRARELAPDSALTGSVKKLSKKAIADGKKPKVQLKNSIISELRQFNRGSIVYVGARWPDANHINFNFGKGRRRFFWDRSGQWTSGTVRGASRKVYKSNGGQRDFKVYENFLKRAADETQTLYMAAFEQAVREQVAKL